MRILLIEPPFHRFMGFYRHYYPLGLAYVAGILATHNHTVRICDAEHDPESRPKTYLETTKEYDNYLDSLNHNRHHIWSEIRREVSRFEPDLIGISVLTVKVPSALKIASICRTACEDVPIVVGGEHPTARPQDLLTNENIDFAVRGEGEQTMLEVAGAIEKRHHFEGIQGLSFKARNQIAHNKDRPFVKNLDNLPFPARDLLAHKETYRPIDFGLMMGSRGCPYRCTFCPNRNIWGSMVRFRSVDSVLDEIRLVQETYSTDYFSFRDYSFSLNSKWTKDFCKMITKKQLHLQWECTTRPDLVSEEIVSYMKAAGCVTIRVGIESGSEQVLKEIRKDISLEQVRKMARILNRHNIYWTAYFMFGLPTETKEDIDKTLSLIEEIDPPFVTMARYTLLPGSDLWKVLQKKQHIDEDHVDWREWGNQWLSKGFTERINPREFQEILRKAAVVIDEHNQRHKSPKPHPLLEPWHTARE